MSEIHNNLKRGQKRFRKFALPVLKHHFGGAWQCVELTKIDLERGVDWYQTSTYSRTDWSVRVWMGRPRRTFSGRLTHLDAPGLELEVGLRFNQMLLDKPCPDMHCEAYIHNDEVTLYVAPFQNVWRAAMEHFPELTTFEFSRNGRTTRFIRIPHNLVDDVECLV